MSIVRLPVLHEIKDSGGLLNYLKELANKVNNLDAGNWYDSGMQIRDIDSANGRLKDGDFLIKVKYTDRGAVRIFLPSAQKEEGRLIIIHDHAGNAGTNNITVTPETDDLIDGATSLTISTNYQAKWIYCDKNDWFTF